MITNFIRFARVLCAVSCLGGAWGILPPLAAQVNSDLLGAKETFDKTVGDYGTLHKSVVTFYGDLTHKVLPPSSSGENPVLGEIRTLIQGATKAQLSTHKEFQAFGKVINEMADELFTAVWYRENLNCVTQWVNTTVINHGEFFNKLYTITTLPFPEILKKDFSLSALTAEQLPSIRNEALGALKTFFSIGSRSRAPSALSQGGGWCSRAGGDGHLSAQSTTFGSMDEMGGVGGSRKPTPAQLPDGPTPSIHTAATKRAQASPPLLQVSNAPPPMNLPTSPVRPKPQVYTAAGQGVIAKASGFGEVTEVARRQHQQGLGARSKSTGSLAVVSGGLLRVKAVDLHKAEKTGTSGPAVKRFDSGFSGSAESSPVQDSKEYSLSKATEVPEFPDVAQKEATNESTTVVAASAASQTTPGVGGAFKKTLKRSVSAETIMRDGIQDTDRAKQTLAEMVKAAVEETINAAVEETVNSAVSRRFASMSSGSDGAGRGGANSARRFIEAVTRKWGKFFSKKTPADKSDDVQSHGKTSASGRSTSASPKVVASASQSISVGKGKGGELGSPPGAIGHNPVK